MMQEAYPAMPSGNPACHGNAQAQTNPAWQFGLGGSGSENEKESA